MPIMRLAFDRASARHIDEAGRLHVLRTHISKATVNPYYGNEIPGYQELGLMPEKIYRLFRDPVELERAASTFERLQILSEHVPVTVDEPRPELVVGAIGSEVTFNYPYLDADICVWMAPAIAGIESGKVKELSMSYWYTPVMTSGEFEGQSYDGVMTDIRGNHLAIVEIGRAGPDVVVADAAFFVNKEAAMTMTKLGKALFVAIGAASPTLAADSAFAGVVGKVRKGSGVNDVKRKILALDASLDSTKLDNIIDAILDVDEEPVAQTTPAAVDESPAAKLRAMLKGKVDDATLEAACGLLSEPAADETDPGIKKEEVEAAMDGLRKSLRDAAEACRDVRGTVGDVFGMDSASDVYGFALDSMKIDRTGVDSVAALRAMFKLASTKSSSDRPQVAQDSGGLEKMFPKASRFRSY